MLKASKVDKWDRQIGFQRERRHKKESKKAIRERRNDE
jgi:hypothetical protein